MTSTAWEHIEYEGGFTTVVVSDEHLNNFPKFMRMILEEKIGLNEGFFKIRFLDGVDFKTNLKEITSLITNHYHPPPTKGKRKTDPSNEVVIQAFFRGGGHQEWYGYADMNMLHSNSRDPLLANAKDMYVNSVCNSQSFENQSTCCIQALYCGEEELIRHYWDFIDSESFGDCIESRDVQTILQSASKVRHKYVERAHTEEPQDLQQETAITHHQEGYSEHRKNYLLYGAGIPIKGTTIPITENFSLSKLQTILDVYPKEVPGLSHPFLYAGNVHATFPWHIEDQALFSINMLHFGAPCVWFFVAPEYYMKLVQWGHHMPLDPSHTRCQNILGHKYLIASKKCLEELGIPVNTVIQKEKEIIVTYPFAAHSGFKTGINVQEAANFADEWWIEPGIFAPTCECFGSMQVHMDLKEIIAVGRPNLLSAYLRRDTLALMKAVAHNQFLQRIKLLPLEQDIVEENILDTGNEIDAAIPSGSSSSQENATDVAAIHKEAEAMMQSASQRPLLICPHGSCDTSYKGGMGKIERLLKHVDSKHSGCTECLDRIHTQYPQRQLKEGQRFACYVCGKLLAGSVTHLNEHIKRIHNK